MAGRDINQVCEKLKRMTLSQEVAGRIEQLIVEQSLEVGAVLPSEVSLAESFGVSRTVIREAFNILRAKGLLRSQPGRGSVVSNPDKEAVTDALKLYLRIGCNTDLFDSLYEIREVLECRTAELAAKRRTDEDIHELRRSLQRMKDNKSDSMQWTQSDLSYHLALARATGNELFPLLLEPVTELLAEVIYLGWSEPSGADSGIASHESILRCVEEQDAEGARRLMLAHVRDSRERVRVWLRKEKMRSSVREDT